MGVYCVIALVFVHVVLGHESQGTDDRAVQLPTCQEITSAIAINQLTLLKMMGGGSHPSTGMAEMEELREEAAARDAKLQEIEKVIQDIKAMIENDVQETLKGMTDREAAAAAARDASLQEMKKVLESLQEEQQNLRAFVENAKQETLNRMASLEQELLTKVTTLEQELVTKVTSQDMEELREEAAARDARLQEVIEDLRSNIQNTRQETLKGMAEMEELREEAAARDAKLQEVTEDLRASQATLEGMAAQQAALRQEMTSEVAALREEMAAQGRVLDIVACPDGWLHHESSCYLVDDTRRSWDNSLEYCKGRGGDLAKITSAEEQEFIKAHWGSTYCCYWIGLNDKASEGRFVWTDGTAPTYTRWQQGQPGGGGGQDCVYMDRTYDGKWHDYPCSYTRGAVCERPVHA